MEVRPLILAVDRNRKNLELLSRALERRSYRSLTANTLDELDQALRQGPDISLALIDLGGLDEGIWLRCDKLRKAEIPFIIISPQNLPAGQRTGWQRGATGVLVKPLVAEELFGLIKSMLGE